MERVNSLRAGLLSMIAHAFDSSACTFCHCRMGMGHCGKSYPYSEWES
jgi:hypothetical protein